MVCDLGILGGGQLASMMIDAAKPLGVKVSVLGKTKEEPALKFADQPVVGDYLDRAAIMAFAGTARALTFDLENVDTTALTQLEAAGKKVFPPSQLLALIQDKLKQKEFFIASGLPTAPIVKDQHSYPVILKARRGGYDGKGVWKVSSAKDLPSISADNTFREAVANIDKELSVLVARSVTGDIKVYPVVEMMFHSQANMLDYLICPAHVTNKMAQEAQSLAASVAEKLKVVGILAVELFLLKSGELWINEVAPRPHNSGHFTIEACKTSQFENHIRAVLEMDLGVTDLQRPTAMFNLVGEPGHSGPVVYEGLEELEKHADVFVHVYGKTHVKPFRKMGHVTFFFKDAEDLKAKLAYRSRIKCVSRT